MFLRTWAIDRTYIDGHSEVSGREIKTSERAMTKMKLLKNIGTYG